MHNTTVWANTRTSAPVAPYRLDFVVRDGYPSETLAIVQLRTYTCAIVVFNSDQPEFPGLG
jgi:hypothetical protein